MQSLGCSTYQQLCSEASQFLCVCSHDCICTKKIKQRPEQAIIQKILKEKKRIFQPKFRNSSLKIRTNTPCGVCALTSANSKGPDDYRILITQPSNIERVIRMGKDISNPRDLVQSLVKIHHILCYEHSLGCWWIRKNRETVSTVYPIVLQQNGPG